MKNRDLVLKLGEIRKDLVNERTFPRCCSLAAKRIYEILGLFPVAGLVLTKKGPELHSWNETDKGEIADLTLVQFKENYSFEIPEILLLEKEEANKVYGYIKNHGLTVNLKKVFDNYNKPLVEYPDFDNFKFIIPLSS